MLYTSRDSSDIVQLYNLQKEKKIAVWSWPVHIKDELYRFTVYITLHFIKYHCNKAPSPFSTYQGPFLFLIN